MKSLDSSIDDLYKGPLDAFIPSRTALARSLKGDAARQVRALEKPGVGSWAINQVYWHARPLYDRVVKSGQKMRAAQIAALKGRRGDLRSATEAHHKAIGDAVTEASRFGAAAGAHPDAEELIRTFEALSLARELPARPGRLTRPLKPAGFEALAGLPIAPERLSSRVSASEQHAAASRDRQLAAEERRKQAALEQAEAAVARAEKAEARARLRWERAKEALERASRLFDQLTV